MSNVMTFVAFAAGLILATVLSLPVSAQTYREPDSSGATSPKISDWGIYGYGCYFYSGFDHLADAWDDLACPIWHDGWPDWARTQSFVSTHSTMGDWIAGVSQEAQQLTGKSPAVFYVRMADGMTFVKAGSQGLGTLPGAPEATDNGMLAEGIFQEWSCRADEEVFYGGDDEQSELYGKYLCRTGACSESQLRDASGSCIPKAEGKNHAPPPELCVGNPINAGTGQKHHEETAYSFGGNSALNYVLSYGSRTAASQSTAVSDHGSLWSSSYSHRLRPDLAASPTVEPAAVYAIRPTGQLIDFRSNGYGYNQDPDVPYRLERQTDSTGVTTAWVLTNVDRDEFESYDAQGKLQSIHDRRGLPLTFAYDAIGRLTTITDAYGRSITRTYDSNNRVQTLIQPDGDTITFAYDNADNLIGITWPDAKTRTYHYEDPAFPNNLTGITDENGIRFATYGYDSTGRAILTEHVGGVQRATLSYGPTSTTVTDALGTQRVRTLQTVNYVIRGTGSSQPAGTGCGPASSVQTYDANGNIATQTDFNGNVTSYTYKRSRNLEIQRVEASGKPESRTISTQWHSNWRLPVKVAVPKKITTYVYNGDGGVFCAPSTATVPAMAGGTTPIGVLCEKSEQPTSDANGSAGFAATAAGTPRAWRWTYDQYGKVLTADGPRTDAADVTAYTYYAAGDPDLGKSGNLASITNALGQVTQVTAYDARGRPLIVIDPNGVATQLQFDTRGRLTGRNVGGESTAYTYDDAGQLTRVTLPDGSYLAYTYDAAHRLTGLADALGNQIVYTLDGLGNRTREEVRDPTGELVRLKQRIFDPLSRLATELGAQNQTLADYTYDANGNQTGISTPGASGQRTTTQSFDALNRIVQVLDPLSGVTRYTYDGQDRTVEVADPRSLVTRYTIDGLGNTSQESSPDTGTTARTFDAAGNVLARTDAKGQVSGYQYDVLNRLVQTTHADGSSESYIWDLGANGVGRLGRIEQRDASGALVLTIQYAYDALGRRTQEARTLAGKTYTTAYHYANGRLVGLTYPSGRRLDYTLNAAGQPTQVQLTDLDGNVKVIASVISYAPFGAVKGLTNGAGQELTWSEDGDGRPRGYSIGGQTWQISYDAGSRIAWQSNLGNAEQTATYAYDDLDRLTQAVLPTTTYGYSYDADGNRTAQTSGAASRTYTYGATSNRLLGLSGSPPKTYSHDANGSLTADGSGTTYAYDARGRLVQSTSAAGTTTYQIDPLGQRVRKTNAQEDSLYHYDDDGRLLSVTAPDGSVREDILWLDQRPLAVLR